MGNKCAEVGAFQDDNDFSFGQGSLDAGIVGAYAAGLFLVLVLIGFYVILAFGRRASQKIVPWWLFGISLILAAIGLIFGIVNVVLRECRVIESDHEYEIYWGLNFPTDLLFYGIAGLVWLGLFMIPLTLGLLRASQVDNKIFTLIQAGIFGLVVLLWIPYFAVSEDWYYQIQRSNDLLSYEDDSDEIYKLLQPTQGLGGTYNLLYLLATVEGGAVCMWALFRLRRTGEAGAGLIGCVMFTFVSLFIAALVTVVQFFSTTVKGRFWSNGAYIAVYVLTVIFQVFAAYGLFFSAAMAPFRPAKRERPSRIATYNDGFPNQAYNNPAYPNNYGAPVAVAAPPNNAVSPVQEVKPDQQYAPVPALNGYQHSNGVAQPYTNGAAPVSPNAAYHTGPHPGMH